jgi:hypothetical protein
VNDPVIALVRPTAVELWPNSVSFTRYPAVDPLATFHVPSSDVSALVGVPDATLVVEASANDSGALDGPWIRWMATNPPTTTTAAAIPPHRAHRFHPCMGASLPTA